jgi:hypothetical protein
MRRPKKIDVGRAKASKQEGRGPSMMHTSPHNNKNSRGRNTSGGPLFEKTPFLPSVYYALPAAQQQYYVVRTTTATHEMLPSAAIFPPTCCLRQHFLSLLFFFSPYILWVLPAAAPLSLSFFLSPLYTMCCLRQQCAQHRKSAVLPLFSPLLRGAWRGA